jgi:hypothetical protein
MAETSSYIGSVIERTFMTFTSLLSMWGGWGGGGGGMMRGGGGGIAQLFGSCRRVADVLLRADNSRGPPSGPSVPSPDSLQRTENPPGIP